MTQTMERTTDRHNETPTRERVASRSLAAVAIVATLAVALHGLFLGLAAMSGDSEGDRVSGLGGNLLRVVGLSVLTLFVGGVVRRTTNESRAGVVAAAISLALLGAAEMWTIAQL